jgi:hypothetical protein
MGLLIAQRDGFLDRDFLDPRVVTRAPTRSTSRLPMRITS